MSDQHRRLEEILDWIESAAAVNPALESHLRVCPQCAHLADEARSLLARFADARLPDPPEDLVRRTLTAARARMAAAISAPADGEADSVRLGFAERFRHHGGKPFEVWATLIADSLRPSPALRGTDKSAPRMVRYETDQFSVAVSFISNAAGESWDITGQVAPKGGGTLPPDAWAAVMGTRQLIETPLSEFGEFALKGVVPVSDELGILVGDSLIRLHIPIS